MAKPMDEYKWHELNVGCVIEEVGNASEYKTGDWRSSKPLWNNEKCIKCGLCWLYCPDAAVLRTDDGFYILITAKGVVSARRSANRGQ
jgi:pyruvate ferredoxin oxidoreductase delta subunit